MSFSAVRIVVFLCCIYFFSGCANIVAPQGGEKDVKPPVLLAITPADSVLSTRVHKIEMRFDEYVTVSDPANEVTISPILPTPLKVEALGKKVMVTIPDSVLRDNTTYRISFGKAIQDVHENNPLTNFFYLFSTGSYFDSLKLHGYVISAATGKRDTNAVVVLYDAAASDSAIVRQKPLYATKADGAGNFLFEGLPSRAMKIYAVADANNNLTYDGGDEMIAFYDTVVVPDIAPPTSIALYLFSENDSASSPQNKADRGLARQNDQRSSPAKPAEGFTYVVATDTSDNRKRTQEITAPLDIHFNKDVASVNANRFNLSYDSLSISVETNATLGIDTANHQLVHILTAWQPNSLYTLRLLKGFAQDSSGTDAMPGKYMFRTKREEDYAKLQIHLPSQYFGNKFLFVVLKDNDTIYHRPVHDTMVTLRRLQPGSYSMRVIMDENENGKWDRGDLFGKRQPEKVVPYNTPINLKAGWENMIDFEEPLRRLR